MKVQCSCGAKCEFEVTPEMARQPVKFVCPACGLDASEFVDGLIRQELGQAAAPPGVPVPIQVLTCERSGARLGTVLSDPPPQGRGEGERPAVAVRLHTPQTTPEASPAAESAEAPRCLKHPGELTIEKCYVCSKPICRKCMELFGYVCSPLCRAKANSHGIQVPVFAGETAVVRTLD